MKKVKMTKPFKVLMIFNGRTPVFPPAINLAEVLSNKGIEFLFVNMSAEEDREETLSGHGRLISLKASPRCIKNTYLRYAIAFIVYTYRLRKLVKKEKPDVLLGCWGGGYLISKLLLLSGLKTRIIFWANEYIRHDELKISNPLRYILWAERKLAHKADLTVVADPVRGKYQGVYLGTKNIMTIRNVPPSGVVPDGPSQLSDLLKKIRSDKPDCRIFAFTGSICSGAKINELLDSFPMWPSNCVLVFVGSVDRDLPDFNTQLSEFSGRMYYLPRIPYIEVSRGLIFADAGIAFYNVDQPWVNEKYCAPCKVGDYMKIGLPILLSCNETLTSLLHQYPVGVAVDPRSAPAIAAGVQVLLDKIDNGMIEKENIRSEFNKSLSMEKQCEPLLQRFEEWQSLRRRSFHDD